MATEQLFQMLTEYRTTSPEDLELLSPAQVKQFVDTMLAHARFNDEYTAVAYDTPEIRRLNPIDRQILGLLVSAKRLRAKLVNNEIHDAVDDVQELAHQLKIPIKAESLNEKIVSRELLRATADYYEEAADREFKERDLPNGHALKALSLSDLEKRFVEVCRRSHSNSNPDTEKSELENLSLLQGDKTTTDKSSSNEISITPPKSTKHEFDQEGTFDRHQLTSAVWDEYIQKLKVEKTRETPNKLLSTLKLWNAMHGESPLQNWDYEKALALRALFLRLPNNYSKGKEWRGQSLIQIADAHQLKINNAISEQEQVTLQEQSCKTVTWNRHRAELWRFWDWGKKRRLTVLEENPFDELWIQPTDDDTVADGGSEVRVNWSAAQIQALFDSPLYTGCQSVHRRHLPGKTVVRDALYWVPLIIAYTGMRREELCQLKVEHLCWDAETGIWYFDLKAKGLKLKNTVKRAKAKQKENPSKRWLPLPMALLDLGIITALHSNRESHEQLFRELYKSSNNNFGDKLGQRFATYRKNYDKARNGTTDYSSVQLYERLRDLHSFRHSFCTELINAHVPQAHAEELSGHKSEARRTAFANYDKGRTLALLKEGIEKRAIPVDVTKLTRAFDLYQKENVHLRTLSN